MEVPSQMIKAQMIQPHRQSAIFKGVKVHVIYLYNFVDLSGDLFVQLVVHSQLSTWQLSFAFTKLCRVLSSS